MDRSSCQEVPVSRPSVECQTKMKEIQLKEICLDIEVQLPRECEREQCGNTVIQTMGQIWGQHLSLE